MGPVVYFIHVLSCLSTSKKSELIKYYVCTHNYLQCTSGLVLTIWGCLYLQHTNYLIHVINYWWPARIISLILVYCYLNWNWHYWQFNINNNVIEYYYQHFYAVVGWDRQEWSSNINYQCKALYGVFIWFCSWLKTF